MAKAKEQEDMRMKPFQFWSASMKILGKSKLGSIYSTKNLRRIYAWGQNPAYTASYERCPLERLRLHLEELSLFGREDIARWAIGYLGRALDEEADELPFPATPAIPSSTDCVKGYVDTMAEVGDIAREMSEAMKDGEIEAEEAVRIRKEVEEAEKALTELKRLLAGLINRPPRQM